MHGLGISQYVQSSFYRIILFQEAFVVAEIAIIRFFIMVFYLGLDRVHMFGYNYSSICIKNMQLRRSEGGCNDMAEIGTNTVDKTAENSKDLQTAMFHYRRFQSAQKRSHELEERQRKLEEALKRMRAKKREAEKQIEETKEQLAFIRKYAGLSRETSNVRKQFAVKGFFDLISLLDSTGTRDVTDAYNYVGNTEWLAGELTKAIMVSGDKSKITIDAATLRKVILDKKNEVDKVIADAKAKIHAEWERQNKDMIKDDKDNKEKAGNMDNVTKPADEKKDDVKTVVAEQTKQAEDKKVAEENSSVKKVSKTDARSAQHGSYKPTMRASYKPNTDASDAGK